MFSTAVQSQLQ